MSKNNIKNMPLFIIISALWLSACDESSIRQQQLYQQHLAAKDLITLAGRNDITNKELKEHVFTYLDQKNNNTDFIDADVNGAKFLHNVAKRSLDEHIYQIFHEVLKLSSPAQLKASVLDGGQSYTVLKYLLNGATTGAENRRLKCIALYFEKGGKDISPLPTEAELENLLGALESKDTPLIVEAMSKANTPELAALVGKWVMSTPLMSKASDAFRIVYTAQTNPLIKRSMLNGFLKADFAFASIGSFLHAFNNTRWGFITNDLLDTQIDLGQGPMPLLLAYLSASGPSFNLRVGPIERINFIGLINKLKNSLGVARSSEWDPYARLSLAELASRLGGVVDAYEMLEIQSPNLSDIKAMLGDLDDDVFKQAKTKNFLFSFLNTASDEDKNDLFTSDLSIGQKLLHKLLSLPASIDIQEMINELLEKRASLAVLGDDPNDFDAKCKKILDMLKSNATALKQAFDTINPALRAKLVDWIFTNVHYVQVREALGHWYSNLPNDNDKMAARSYLLNLTYNSPTDKFYWLFSDDCALKAGIAAGDLYELAKNPGPGMLRGQLIQVVAVRAAQDEIAGISATKKIENVAENTREVFINNDEQNNAQRWSDLITDKSFGTANGLGNFSVEDFVNTIPSIPPKYKGTFTKTYLIYGLLPDEVNKVAYDLANDVAQADLDYLEEIFHAFYILNPDNLNDLALSRINGTSFLENLMKLRATQTSYRLMRNYLRKLEGKARHSEISGDKPKSLINKFLEHGDVDGGIPKYRQSMLVYLIHFGADDELKHIDSDFKLSKVFFACYKAAQNASYSLILIKAFKAISDESLIPTIAQWAVKGKIDDFKADAFNEAYQSADVSKQQIMRNSLISESYVKNIALVSKVISRDFLPEEALKLGDYNLFNRGQASLLYLLLNELMLDVSLDKQTVSLLAKKLKAKFSGPDAENDWRRYLDKQELNFANQSIIDLVVTAAGVDEATAKSWLAY